MSEIILYPTETIYALGVNAFDEKAWQGLCHLKGRQENQTASWLVRTADDIERFGVVTPKAEIAIAEHLPGSLTVVLKAKDNAPNSAQAPDGTVSFRISSDPVAANLIKEYMDNNDGVPLTCTSANVHGEAPAGTVEGILNQFGEKQSMITRRIDGGPRNGQASTVVRFVDDKVEVLRQGSVKL